MWDPAQDLKTTTLNNGVVVRHLFIDRPFVHVLFCVHSGAGSDRIPGTAHFVEHLVCHDTVRSAKQLILLIDLEGGKTNFGATSFEATTYGARVPVAHFDACVEMFTGMLARPQLADRIEQERLIIFREYARSESSASQRRRLLIRKALYPSGHPLREYLRPLGTYESIEAIGRDDLESFLDRHYVGANMSVIVVGGVIDPVATIAQHFSAMPVGQPNPPLPTIDIPPPSVASVAFPWSEFEPERPHGCKVSWLAGIPEDRQLLMRLCEVVVDNIDDVVRGRMNASYGFRRSVEPFDGMREVSISGEVPWSLRPELDGIYSDAVAKAIADVERLKEVRVRAIARRRLLDLSVQDVYRAIAACVIHRDPVCSIAQEIEELERVTIDELQESLRMLARDRAVRVEMCD